MVAALEPVIHSVLSGEQIFSLQALEPQTHASLDGGSTLLATALVQAIGPIGITANDRAFLDMGSQMSCVTESLVQYLQLRKQPLIGGCTGFGQTPVSLNGMVNLNIASWDGTHQFSINAGVMRKKPRDLPTRAITVNEWNGSSSLKLADPKFGTPGPVAILLGAEVIGSLLDNGFMPGKNGMPHAMCTKLGWILFGPISYAKSMAMTPDKLVNSMLTETPTLTLLESLEELSKECGRFRSHWPQLHLRPKSVNVKGYSAQHIIAMIMADTW